MLKEYGPKLIFEKIIEGIVGSSFRICSSPTTRISIQVPRHEIKVTKLYFGKKNMGVMEFGNTIGVWSGLRTGLTPTSYFPTGGTA
jgi:hypothetical protein